MPNHNDSLRRAGLGFGANLGAAAANIAQAMREIEQRDIGRLLAVSSLWRTAPWGATDQPDFFNACALIETRWSGLALLHGLKQIERDLGRVPAERWGPRHIDIDIVFLSGVTTATQDLILPHRQALQRAFVLAPMAEIAPDEKLESLSVREALARVDKEGVNRVVTPLDWPVGVFGACRGLNF